MIIAIDFDGTIVDDAFPEIGEPKLFVFETLKQLVEKRHQLILWTTRTGNQLQKAVDFCKENGVEFYAINNSYPDEKFQDMESRKIMCDLFISNKNFGGIPGWGEIWQEVQRAESGVDLSNLNAIPEKGLKGLLKKLFTKR
jgi:hypothetical protein